MYHHSVISIGLQQQLLRMERSVTVRVGLTYALLLVRERIIPDYFCLHFSSTECKFSEIERLML